MSRKFKIGEVVMAKPLKSPIYHSAEVTAASGNEYTVRFSTGEVQKVAAKFVITTERRRGRSASKSPSRDIPKSPGRKSRKSESKSPGRPKKTPQKAPKAETKKEPAAKAKRERSKSRGRSKKEPAKKEKRRSASTETAKSSSSVTKKEKKSAKKVSGSPDPDIDLLVQKKVDEKLEMLETSRPEEFSQTESESEEVEIFTAPPKSQTVVDSKVTVVEKTGVYKRSSARLAAKAGGLDEATRISLMAEPRPVTTKRDQLYFGNIGVLLSLPLSAALVFWVNIACQKASCAFLEKPRFPNNWVVTFLSMDYLLAYAGFCVAQMLFSVLPVGKRLRCGESTFRNNAWLAALLTGAIVGALTYYKYPVLSKEKDIYTLMAAAFIHVLLASTFAYVLGRNASAGTINPKGNAGRFLYDWFVGRELNPMYKWFSFKQLAMRTAYLGWAVIVGCILWRAHAGADKLSWTMAFTGGSQLLYVALQLFREKNLGATPTGKTDGVGYAFLWTYSCYVPFVPLLMVRYVRAFKIQQSITFLGAAAAVYLVGLVLSLAGKWLKTKYGKKGSAASHGSLMSRFCGKVKDSWFGFLRNGSRFGELFMVLGMTLPCGFDAVYPWTYMAITSVATVYRLYSETRGR